MSDALHIVATIGFIAVLVATSALLAWGTDRLQRWRNGTGRSGVGAVARSRILDALDDGEWHPEVTVFWMAGRGDVTVNQQVLDHMVREGRIERRTHPSGTQVRIRTSYVSEVPSHVS